MSETSPQEIEEPGRVETLFPKISGKHQEFIRNICYFREQPKWPKDITSIPLIGTVKLHGTHNDIVIHADNTIQLQSRNTVMDIHNDPYKFVHSMLPLHSELLNLRQGIHARFRQRNPGVEIEDEHPLIIAGEWVGPGVQKACAINKIDEKIFVIFSISINGKWQPDEEYADISNPDARIYHVSRGGWYRCSVPNGTMEEMAAALKTLQPLADEVERECPFARTLGKLGQGEGIVFKPTLGFLGEDARFWLKVKGPLSMTGGLSVPKVKMEIGMEKAELAQSFAESVVTEPRLEQGWEYLREMGIEQDQKGVAAFLKWLTGDIEIEEKGEIKSLGIDWGVLKKKVAAIGKVWYFKRVTNG